MAGLLANQPKSYLANVVLRFFQFVLGVTVIGLYGVDLNNARKAGKYSDSKWGYAVAVGVLSAITALLWMIPLFMRRFHWMFVWDAILFFMWIVLFGIFGKMYINENPEGNSGIQRMKNAVWVVLVNMLLWLISTALMAWNWWKVRTGRTQFTGRAVV